MAYDEHAGYADSARRRKLAREFRRVDCDHVGDKKIEGNKIICLKCKRLAGLVRDPRKVRS